MTEGLINNYALEFVPETNQNDTLGRGFMRERVGRTSILDIRAKNISVVKGNHDYMLLNTSGFSCKEMRRYVACKVFDPRLG